MTKPNKRLYPSKHFQALSGDTAEIQSAPPSELLLREEKRKLSRNHLAAIMREHKRGNRHAVCAWYITMVKAAAREEALEAAATQGNATQGNA